MRDEQDSELIDPPGPGLALGDLALSAPILAGKLSRLTPGQLTTIFTCSPAEGSPTRKNIAESAD
ncbi:hypothetical protein ACFRJ9_19950 [Paenarthrobacter sp. NPDC056912]|uniref:hypothetical protein n=1 Tax=Paenarthrobacter sp. NPDC056912 TaxID=3345965 RepID=UPI00366D673A